MRAVAAVAVLLVIAKAAISIILSFFGGRL